MYSTMASPRWGQTLHFQLPAPELVLVLFVVEDYDSTSPSGFVGQFTLPLNSLKPGFRHIRLPCQGRGLTVISHALSTSVSSAAEGVADPPVVLQVPVLILWQKPSPPLEWRGDGRASPSSLPTQPAHQALVSTGC